jgi:CheY-like chemotaxis protein
MLAYSGKGRFAMHSLDLNDVVRETLELLEVSITKKAALRVELRPGVPHVMADPAQIRQVIMNLVINASEAIGDSSGLIRIRTGMLEADTAYFHNAAAASDMPAGEYIFLEVIDSGCGMSPETQARIFEPFYTTKFTGRGLGLAAVLGIVRGHNGALKITSEVGHGSSFKLVLPAVKALPPPQPAVTRGSTARWKGEGTILVVDDDPTVRAVTSRMVEAFGFNVLQAVDGLHGVEVFSEKQDTIRAVVLDMTMPKLNGSEALQQMRRIRPEVKVLMVSGFCEQPSGVLSQRSSPDGFLQKPYKPDELASKLRSLFAESPVASAGHNNGANQKLGMVSHN